MKFQNFSLVFYFLIIIGCNSSPDLANDISAPTKLPIEIHEELPYTVALASDGKVWQWIHNKGNQVSGIDQMEFGNIHSVGIWNNFGWALRNDGVPTYWALQNPKDYETEPDKKPVKKIAGSSTHLIHLYIDGTMGFRLGRYGVTRAYEGLLSLENVVDVAAGSNCSLACTEDGKVYVTGENDGNYIAWVKDDWIDSAHHISGLENIVKVGVAPGERRYYAVDNQYNLYFWGYGNFNKKPILFERKSRELIDDNLLLEEDGTVTQFAVLPPRSTNGTRINFIENPHFADDIYYHSYKAGYMAVDTNGTVTYFNRKVTWTGDLGKPEPVVPVKIEGFSLDLSYFKK